MSWWLFLHASDIATKEENTISASAVLEWKKTQNVGELKGYIVLYKSSQFSTYWNVVQTNDTQVSLKNIQPRTEYTVRVLLLSEVTYMSQTFILETGVGKFPLKFEQFRRSWSRSDFNLHAAIRENISWPIAMLETKIQRLVRGLPRTRYHLQTKIITFMIVIVEKQKYFKSLHFFLLQQNYWKEKTVTGKEK